MPGRPLFLRRRHVFAEAVAAGRDWVIAARLTRARMVRRPKAGPGGRTGRDGAAPGRRRAIRRGRYRAAGHELRCLPGACGRGCWRRGASGQRRAPCPSWSRTIAATTVIRNAQPAARPDPSSARQHSAPTEAGQRARDAHRRTRSAAAADQDRPAAVTAATARTPLQITRPRRSPGPAAITEKTPKNGLEITAVTRAPRRPFAGSNDWAVDAGTCWK